MRVHVSACRFRNRSRVSSASQGKHVTLTRSLVSLYIHLPLYAVALTVQWETLLACMLFTLLAASVSQCCSYVVLPQVYPGHINAANAATKVLALHGKRDTAVGLHSQARATGLSTVRWEVVHMSLHISSAATRMQLSLIAAACVHRLKSPRRCAVAVAAMFPLLLIDSAFICAEPLQCVETRQR